MTPTEVRSPAQGDLSGNADHWSPSRFVLRGEYCPEYAIAGYLEKVRTSASAEVALLLSGDDRAVLRSLCFQASGESSNTQALRLIQILRTTDGLNKRGDLKNLLRNHGSDSDVVRAGPIIDALKAIAREQKDAELADWISTAGSWVAVEAPDFAREARISTTLLLLEPGDADGPGWGAPASDQAFAELTLRVNATAQADVRRDAAIMARLDNELDPADFAESTVDLKQAADALVGLAVEVSGSDVGACYVYDHGAKAMQLVATAASEDEVDPGGHFPAHLDLGSRSLALSCLRSRRLLQLPPGLPASQDTEFTYLTPEGERQHSLELATPIVGPLASPKAPAVGVLTVVRLGEKTRPYGAYEMAVLRNIGLRMALITATANAEAAARIFAGLSKRATEQIRSGTASQGRFQGVRLTSAVETAWDAPLPDDLLMPLSAIQQGLETLGKITGSHSATFRAALPSEQPTGAHGLTLRRIAAYPHPCLQEDGEVQTETDGGINWRVALAGRPQYVPIVKADETYLERRKETLSELCVPVFVEGRVIGVVNLESGSHNAYDAQLATAQAFAAHVGLAIADARIAVASVLHDYATEIVRRGHTLGGKECKELRDLGEQAEPRSVAQRILELADEVEVAAKGLRRFTPGSDPDADCVVTFPQLVAEEVDRIELTFATLDIDPYGNWSVYPNGVAEIVRYALRDILHNVKRHASTGGKNARLRIHQCPWGGRENDILTITNRALAPLLPEDAANAFRALLARESPDLLDRRQARGIRVPQLGAYLAGSMARRVGGEVHLSQGVGTETRVTLSIPSNPQQQDWLGGSP